MPSVLAGIHVIDFGQYIAGPLTGMLLADQGADVIRVDPPGWPGLGDASERDLEPREAQHQPRSQAA